jgi:hypothetical protein
MKQHHITAALKLYDATRKAGVKLTADVHYSLQGRYAKRNQLAIRHERKRTG